MGAVVVRSEVTGSVSQAERPTTIDVPGASGNQVTAINDSGQMAGNYFNGVTNGSFLSGLTESIVISYLLPKTLM